MSYIVSSKPLHLIVNPVTFDDFELAMVECPVGRTKS